MKRCSANILETGRNWQLQSEPWWRELSGKQLESLNSKTTHLSPASFTMLATLITKKKYKTFQSRGSAQAPIAVLACKRFNSFSSSLPLTTFALSLQGSCDADSVQKKPKPTTLTLENCLEGFTKVDIKSGLRSVAPAARLTPTVCRHPLAARRETESRGLWMHGDFNDFCGVWNDLWHSGLFVRHEAMKKVIGEDLGKSHAVLNMWLTIPTTPSETSAADHNSVVALFMNLKTDHQSLTR